MMKNGHSPADPEINQSTFTLSIVEDYLRAYGGKIALFSLLGGLFGFGITYIVPHEWEAKSILQVGQIYSARDGGANASAIELPARTVERMISVAFEDEVLRSLNLSVKSGISADADLLRSSTSVRLIRNADLIELATKARSPEKAKLTIDAYEKIIFKAHRKLLQPSLDRLTADLRVVEQSIGKLESEEAMLSAAAQGAAKQNSSAQFAENVLLNQLRTNNDTQLIDYRRRRVALMEQLSPERTYNTFAVAPVTVSQQPVFPKRSIFTLLGIIAGLVVMLMSHVGGVLLRASK